MSQPKKMKISLCALACIIKNPHNAAEKYLAVTTDSNCRRYRCKRDALLTGQIFLYKSRQ